MTDIKEIDRLVEEERKAANKEHGETFASWHEAWAVLLEELQEVNAELKYIRNTAKDGFVDLLWKAIKQDKPKEQMMWLLNAARERLVKAVQELIQAIGVIDKALGKPLPFDPCENCNQRFGCEPDAMHDSAESGKCVKGR